MNTIDEINDETPFVREECGDTMWDDVLAEKEQQEAKPVPVTSSAPETVQLEIHT